jgi:ABC-type branched-subunit amino acid transport system substrate-binding protein
MVIAGINSLLNNQPTTVQGAQVAEKNINAGGGLRGRDVAITICNHQGTADGAVACARQAVQQKMDDVLSVNNTFSQASTPILSAAGIKQIASQAAANVDFKDPNSYPLFPGSEASWAADVFYLTKVLGKHKIAGIGYDLTTSLEYESIAKQAIKASGAQLATWLEVPATTTDYAPIAQKIKSSGADAVVTITAQTGELAWVKAASQLGLNVPFTHWTLTVGENDFATYPGKGAGLVIASPFPIYSQQLTGVQEFLKQMKQAGYGPDIYTTAPAMGIWLELYAIKALAAMVPQGTEITGDSLAAAAKAAKTPIDVQGLLSWAPGVAGPAQFPNAANDTTFVSVVGADGKLHYKETLHPWQLLGIAPH